MAYAKPAGYKTDIGVGAQAYKPNNGFLSGNMGYAPGAPTAQVITLNISNTPANGSSIQVPDGPPNAPGTPTKNFVFTYAGSPGTGIIPLVAGGGTAAQAATAAQVAMAAQLNNWTVANPSSGIVTLTAKNRGINVTVTTAGGAQTAVTSNGAKFTNTLPGRAGMNGAFLSG